MTVIDTLEIADELSRDGVFSREQAERLARISARTASETLVTKAEFELGLAAIRSDIASMQAGVMREFQALRTAGPAVVRTTMRPFGTRAIHW